MHKRPFINLSTLSLHDALPIWSPWAGCVWSPSSWSSSSAPSPRSSCCCRGTPTAPPPPTPSSRSEEHTSELQSRRDLVCRLLLEKKKTIQLNVGFTK